MALCGQSPFALGARSNNYDPLNSKRYGSDTHVNPMTAADGGLGTDPLLAMMSYLGKPNKSDNELYNMSRDTETLASAFEGSCKRITDLIIRGSLGNYELEFFQMLPPRRALKDEIGRTLSFGVLRLEDKLPEHTPEMTAPTLSRHSYDVKEMTHKRYGTMMMLPYDFAMTPEGDNFFNEEILRLNMNMIILGQEVIVDTFLRVPDAYKDRRISLQKNDTSVGWADIDMRFGALSKREKAINILINYAKKEAKYTSNPGFTHVVHSAGVKELLIYGNNYETEFWRKGPEAPENLKNGDAAAERMFDGMKLVAQPDYNLSNVDADSNKMVTAVQLGRVGFVNPLDPSMFGTRDYHYLNLDEGQGQIMVQSYKDLNEACLCWDPDGELDANCYDYLTSPGNAESFASESLGIRTIRSDENNSSIIRADPFLVDNEGKLEKVQYQGNQDTYHCSTSTQAQIVDFAYQRLRDEINFGDDIKLINAMLDFANRNYQPPIDNVGDVEAFVFATANANGPGDMEGRRVANRDFFVSMNEFGSPNLPSLVAKEAAPGGAVAYFLATDEYSPVYKVISASVSRAAQSGWEGDADLDGLSEQAREDVLDDPARRGFADGASSEVSSGKTFLQNVTFDENGKPDENAMRLGLSPSVLRLLGMFPSYVSLKEVFPDSQAPYFPEPSEEPNANFGNPRAYRGVLVARTNPVSSVSSFGGLNGTLPGFSNMSHMRYLADAYRSGSAGLWLQIPEYNNMLRTISEGMYALDRITASIRDTWSLPGRPNFYFDDKNIPFYQKNEDSDSLSLTTFQQNAIQGIRYPVGMQVTTAYNVYSQTVGAEEAGGERFELLELDPVMGHTVRQGGIPPSGGTLGEADSPQYYANLRNLINNSISNVNIRDVGRDIYDSTEGRKKRKNPGATYETYPDSGLDFMVRMGFAPQFNILPGFVATPEQEKLGKVGVWIFDSGSMTGELLEQLRTNAGVDEWIRKYEQSPQASPSETGLRDASWTSMANQIVEMMRSATGYPNLDAKTKGDIFATIIDTIDSIIDPVRNEGETHDGGLGQAEMKNLVRFTSQVKQKRPRFTNSDASLNSREDPRKKREELARRKRDFSRSLHGPKATTDAYSPAYINTRLAIAPDYWKKLGHRVSQITGSAKKNMGATLSILRPADPEAPNTRYLGITPDFHSIATALTGANRLQGDYPPNIMNERSKDNAGAFSEEIVQFARGRASNKMNSMMVDPVIRRLAEDPHSRATMAGAGYNRGNEITYQPDGRSAGDRFSKYPAFLEDIENDGWAYKAGRKIRNQQTAVELGGSAPGPHYSLMHTLTGGGPLSFNANQFFAKRYEFVTRSASNDYIRRALHLAFMGLPIHRDVFANLMNAGIPPPITLLPADPFMDFRMSSMIFVRGGSETGFLSYYLRDISLSYNGSYKILYGNLTAHMGGLVLKEENVFVVDHVAFDRYLRGANGKLVRTLNTDGEYNTGGTNVDFDYQLPLDRKAHRFVLYAGASYRDCDVPDPLPLTGSYYSSNYAGMGQYVKPNEVNETYGMAYPSALVVNLKTGFHKLNSTRIYSDNAEGIPFSERNNLAQHTFNMLCSRSNQWGMNNATGDTKRRIKNGTGPLGILCEGVKYILNGKPGLIENELRRTEKKSS